MAQNHTSNGGRIQVICALLILNLTLCISASSQESPFYSEKGVAIKGYDPVAYFTEHRAVEGSSEHRVEWSGVIWQFKDEANLVTFERDPAKYAPQYGGWCAYGVSENHKSPTDPFAWTIVDEKLYLNYSPKVKEKWSGDRDKHIDQADKNWLELKNK